MGTKVSYSGNVNLTINEKKYIVVTNAIANYWYQPCVMYFKDGTGQPEDWDYEIEDVKSTWYELNEQKNEIQITPTEDMLEVLEDWLNENAEWEFPEDPSDDPPEYEPEE